MVGRLMAVLFICGGLLVACGYGDGDVTPALSSPDSIQAPEPTSTPSGPRVVVEPRSGPPGIEVTVRGSGWEPGVLVDLTGALAPGVTADPYETVVSGADGSFIAKFRLETAPDGGELSTGRYDLIVRTSSSEVTFPFIVETRRPVSGPGVGG